MLNVVGHWEEFHPEDCNYTLDLIRMEKNDKVFLQEVNKGIVLWGGKDE